MASLVRRGKKYYVAWREGGVQRRKSLKTTKKAEADKLLEVWHREQARDRIHGAFKNPTIADFAADYDDYARHHLKQKTRDTQAQRWRDFILWFAKDRGMAVDPDDKDGFGVICQQIRMADISSRDIERFKTFLLDDGKSKTTVNNYLRDISARFGRGIKRKVFSGPNPCSTTEVERLKQETSPPPYLTQEQITALLAAAGKHGHKMHWFCLLGIYAGLRLGEIVNTQWTWFDWSGRLLNIPSDEVFSAKSHKGRSIPLSTKIIEAMQPHAQAEGYVFEAGTPTGLVKTGAWLYRWNPKTAFNTVLKKAELDKKGITPHVLRHTFGTQLARRGVSIYKIREWMGHSDVKTTKIYANVQGYDDEIDKL